MYTSALISLVICVIEGVLFSSWWVNSSTAKEFISIFTSVSSGLFAIVIASFALYLNVMNIISSALKDNPEAKEDDETNEVVDNITRGGSKLTIVGVGAFVSLFSAIIIHGFVVLFDKSVSIFILLLPQFLMIFSLIFLATAFVSVSRKDKQVK